MQSQGNQVVINKDDAKNTRDFFKHFNIEMPTYLDQVLSSIENAEVILPIHHANMKAAVARALIESRDKGYELLQDELFNEVMPNCEREWFDRQFEQDFENYDAEDKKD
jgi:hypothetical protein